MSGDILDSIDGALRDWETSGDAMRWRPPEDRGVTINTHPGDEWVVGGTLDGLPREEAGGWTTSNDGLPIGMGGVLLMVGPVGSQAPTPSELERMVPVGGVVEVRITPDTSAFEAALSRIDFSTVAAAMVRALDRGFLRHQRRRSSRWMRYPGEHDGRLWPHVSDVCRGWLCGSCTDRSCVHTCHGGHLR